MIGIRKKVFIILLSLQIIVGNARVYAADFDIDKEEDLVLDEGGLIDCWYLESMGYRELTDTLKEVGKEPVRDVVVAVIDTGLDTSCDALQGALWCNTAELEGKADVDDDGNGYVDDVYGLNLANRYAYMTDIDGHGTQVAGVIAMQPEDDDGSSSISGSIKIMPIKASIDTNYGMDAIVKAIEYAVDMGADVINMSFASYSRLPKMEEAVRRASESCVLVAAAGNEKYVTEGDSLSVNTLKSDGYKVGDTYPASWDCCIGVMSYDRNEQLAYFSNWDQAGKYDIIAPGSQILTVSGENRYVMVNGTSFSTAMVSRSVAMLRAVVGDEISAPELKDLYLSLMTHSVEHTYGEHTFLYPKCMMSDLLPYLMAYEQGEDPQDEPEGNPKDAPEDDPQDEPEDDLKDKSENDQGNTAGGSTGDSKGSSAGDGGGSAGEYPKDSEGNVAKHNNLPRIKRVYTTSKYVKVVFEELPSDCKTKVIFCQKQNGKQKTYTVNADKKVIRISKNKLRRKLCSTGKITIKMSYRQPGKKRVEKRIKKNFVF